MSILLQKENCGKTAFSNLKSILLRYKICFNNLYWRNLTLVSSETMRNKIFRLSSCSVAYSKILNNFTNLENSLHLIRPKQEIFYKPDNIDGIVKVDNVCFLHIKQTNMSIFLFIWWQNRIACLLLVTDSKETFLFYDY